MSAGRVCVIGAGAAGLCATRHLLHNTNFQPVVFEQTQYVGGTWVFNEGVGKDHHGNPIHSSMYKRMKTNLPKEVMAFVDFPFPESKGSSFVSHKEVRQYLERYCDHFKLRDAIKFEHRVSKVQSIKGAESDWKVTIDNLNTGDSHEECFSAVIVSNGHYFMPNVPDIPGMEKYKGELMHSHDYRLPEKFKGKTVAMLGAAASGMDIGLEVASEASKVFLSHNRIKLSCKLPDNLTQVAGITECIGERLFKLLDGSEIKADAVLFCTGYEYTFPFLQGDCQVQVSERNVYPLYKHMVHARHPTMAFIGIPIQVLPFPLFDFQAAWFCSIITGNYKLPSLEKMLREIREEKESRINSGVLPKHFHKFESYQWGYIDELADLAHVKQLPRQVQELYDRVHKYRLKHLMTYKEQAYYIT